MPTPPPELPKRQSSQSIRNPKGKGCAVSQPTRLTRDDFSPNHTRSCCLRPTSTRSVTSTPRRQFTRLIPSPVHPGSADQVMSPDAHEYSSSVRRPRHCTACRDAGGSRNVKSASCPGKSRRNLCSYWRNSHDEGSENEETATSPSLTTCAANQPTQSPSFRHMSLMRERSAIQHISVMRGTPLSMPDVANEPRSLHSGSEGEASEDGSVFEPEPTSDEDTMTEEVRAFASHNHVRDKQVLYTDSMPRS